MNTTQPEKGKVKAQSQSNDPEKQGGNSSKRKDQANRDEQQSSAIKTAVRTYCKF